MKKKTKVDAPDWGVISRQLEKLAVDLATVTRRLDASLPSVAARPVDALVCSDTIGWAMTDVNVEATQRLVTALTPDDRARLLGDLLNFHNRWQADAGLCFFVRGTDWPPDYVLQTEFKNGNRVWAAGTTMTCTDMVQTCLQRMSVAYSIEWEVYVVFSLNVLVDQR